MIEEKKRKSPSITKPQNKAFSHHNSQALNTLGIKISITNKYLCNVIPLRSRKGELHRKHRFNGPIKATIINPQILFMTRPK